MAVLNRIPLGWALYLALRRLGAQWRSLLTVIAGVLLSASVGALIPLYTTAVAQVSMVERFNQLPPADVNIAASIALIPAQAANNFTERIAALDAKIRDLAKRHLGDPFPDWLIGLTAFGESSALSVNPPAVAEPGTEARIPDPTTRVYVADYEGWAAVPGLTILGRPPVDPPTESGADIEIAIPLEAQGAQGVNIGDVLTLDQGGPRGGWPTSKNVLARVVALIDLPTQAPTATRAYFMAPSPARYTVTKGEFQAEYTALTPRSAFLRVVTTFVPDTPSRIGWRLLFDHSRLPLSRSPEARDALQAFQADVLALFSPDQNDGANLGLSYRTRLVDFQQQASTSVDQGVLISYEREVRSLDAPFGLLLLQVGALVIFYLMVTAALVRRNERREIAMLQSRGAHDRSLVIVRGLEALIICAIGAILAPILAQQLLIAITPFFARYPNLPLALTPQVFSFAATAALIAFVALIMTLRPVLRLPLISAGGAALRSNRQPWWQRYYLDVLLVILGAAALLRLAGRSTPLFTTSAGASATDPFLLLAPAFLFLGLGSALLRLFPALAGGAARLLSVGRGLIGPMATWQLSREPLHYGRITFLLALAVGIGWFATSFRATVDRSQTDQAQYRVGADARFAERDVALNAGRARPLTAYTALPGVEAASIAWRKANVNYQFDPRKAAINGMLLGVDSDTLAQVAHWRSDLGTLQTPRTPTHSTTLPIVGHELPFLPRQINLWARFETPGAGGIFVPDLDRLLNRTSIFMRFQDRSGAWFIVPFKVRELEYNRTGATRPGIGGSADFAANGWAFMEADLTALAYKPVEPIRLVSILWQHRARSQLGERFLSLTMADLTAVDPGGERRNLSLFNDDAWEFAYDSGALTEGRVTHGFVDDRRGIGINAFWDQFAETTRSGALLNYPASGPIPLIPSAALADQLGLAGGQTFSVRSLEGLTVEFQVPTGATPQRYYPTLYDAQVGAGSTSGDQYLAFGIADRDALLYALNRRPGATLYPDEVWLKAGSGQSGQSLIETVRAEAIKQKDRPIAILADLSVQGALADLQTDPFSRGLLGLMLLAFIIALALSTVGLITYAALTATARRGEFGVLRALGLSPLRIISQLLVEQFFVIGLGVILGAILGMVLSGQVVPRLAQDASGAQITPPFIVQVETGALLQYGAILAGVIVLVMLTSLLLVRQLSLSRTLRLGEE